MGWYDSPTNLYIAMEYLPVGDLQAYLSERTPLNEKEAREITHQTLEGLDHMHREGFAHRDVKPGNLLIKSHSPDLWWVKLSDFGISKRSEASAEQLSTFKGTVSFMAPELFGYEPGSPYMVNHQAADMWSLGEWCFAC